MCSVPIAVPIEHPYHTHTTPPHPNTSTLGHLDTGAVRRLADGAVASGALGSFEPNPSLPSLHLTYPFVHLPLTQAGMARRTEQLRGQQFGWGRGVIFTHLCHLSGRLLSTARLGGNGGVTVFKGTETDTDTELRRVSSARY